MTGYSFVEGEIDGWVYSIDIKGYNNRYFDLSVNMPPILQSKEPAIREMFQERVARGRIEIFLRLRDANPAGLEVDPDAVAKTVQTIAQIRSLAGIGGPIELQHLLMFMNDLRAQPRVEIESLWSSLKGPFQQAFDQFEKVRQQEGVRTRQDIEELLSVIEKGLEYIKDKNLNLESELRSAMNSKIRELNIELDPIRLYNEVALLLLRYGIHEELSRLESHLKSFWEWIDSRDPVGKKLDFLCQEIGREVNTIASKVNSADIQLKVVEMKDAIENIREQLRNVE